MKYDLEANLFSWEISQGKIDKVVELGNFLIHISKTGKPILIEVLEASKFKTKQNLVKLAQTKIIGYN